MGGMGVQDWCTAVRGWQFWVGIGLVLGKNKAEPEAGR